MIPFRHHVVSLFAVFLALAVGVVLGGGPLSDVGARSGIASAPVDASDPDGAEAFAQAFAGSVAPAVLWKRLKDRDVALVALPGAEEGVLDELEGRIEDARGRVAGRYSLNPTLLAPAEKQLIDTLGSQLASQYGKRDVDGSVPTYERLGQLLALALASTDAAGEDVGARSSSVLASLTGADVAAAEGEPRRRAPLVLFVLGDEPVDVVLSPDDAGAGPDAESDVEEVESATDVILAGLLTGVREGSAGVMLAGSTASGVNGALARLREDDRLARVSTLDGVETQAGQVSVPLALERALAGTSGAYGASGADGAVPLG